MQPSESDSGFARPARRRHVAPWDHDLLGGILAPFGGGAAGILIVNETVAHAQQAPELKPFVDTLDRNVERLNGLFFTFRDYAVIARRP